MASPATISAPAAGTSGADVAGDVLVVFGITGDLAKVMTFRSLYRLEARGLLDCPIVGVAVDDWTVDDLRERAETSIEGTGEKLDEDGVRPFRRTSLVCLGRLRRPGAPTNGSAAAIEGMTTPVFYLEIPPFLFGQVVKQLSDAGLTKGARVVVEKPFGHDLASARRARGRAAPVHRRVPALPDRPLPREDGPARRSSICGSQNTMLEPIWSRNYVEAVEITMAEDVRRRGPRALLRPRRSAARRRRQPPDAGGRRRGDGGAVARRRGHAQELGRPRSSARSRRRSRSTTCAASTTATARSTASTPTRRPRRTRRSGSTSRTGAGPACRSSSAPASVCR